MPENADNYIEIRLSREHVEEVLAVCAEARRAEDHDEDLTYRVAKHFGTMREVFKHRDEAARKLDVLKRAR